MTTKSHAIRSVAFNWLGRCCSIAIVFFLTPFLVHTLGNERYGLWAIVMSLTNYYSLANLGLRSTGAKFIAEHHALGNRTKVNQIIVTTTSIYAVVAVVVMAVVGGMAWLIPALCEMQYESVTTIRWVIMFTGLNFAIRLVCKPLEATLAGLTRFDLLACLSLGVQISQAVLFVVVLKLGGGLLEMALAALGLGISGQIFQYLFARRALGYLNYSLAHVDRGLVTELFSFSVSLVIISGASRLATYAGLLIIGAVLGPAMVTFYAIADRLIQKPSHFSKGVASVVMPVASGLNATNRREELLRMMVLVSRALQTLGWLLLIGFVVLGRYVIELWVGEEYVRETYPVLCLLATANAAMLITGGMRSMLVGMGRVKPLRAIAVLDALLTVGLGIPLVTSFGLTGMASAVLISQAATCGVLLPVVLCRLLEYPWRRFVKDTILPSMLAGVPGLVTAMGFSVYLPPSRLYVLILQGLCVALVTATSAYFICLPADVQKGIREALLPRRRAGVKKLADTQNTREASELS